MTTFAVSALAAGCTGSQATAPGPRPPSLEARAAQAPFEPDLDFEIEAREDSIHVRETFRMPKDRVRLQLTHSFGGDDGFERGVIDLASASPNATVARDDDRNFATVTANAGSEVTLAYTVHETDPGPNGQRRFRPYIDKKYFEFFGNSVLVTPDLGDGPRKIRISWTVPQNFMLANSFGQGATVQDFSASMSDLHSSVFVGGDFRLQRADVRGRLIFVAMRGEFPFKDEEVLDLTRRVVDVERAFWNDDDFPYYLVTMMATGGPCCGYGGAAITNAFATHVTADRFDDRLRFLFTHELFHVWAGQRIRTAGPERAQYWFSEGFTDYYAYLLALRAGLIDLDAYVKAVNDRIRSYRSSPVLRESNQAIVDRFWKDTFMHQLPYQRGALLAANWNAKIIAATAHARSLDDVMHDLLSASREGDFKVSAQTFDAATRPYLRDGVAGGLEKYVERGEVIEPDPSALGPCVELEMADVATFDVGFDHVPNSAKIDHVQKDGPAYRAGVREDQRFVGGRWRVGHPEEAVEMEVRDPKNNKLTFKFLPQGKPVKVPRYRVGPETMAKDKARCLAWFGVKG